jgi:hypothetical protein
MNVCIFHNGNRRILEFYKNKFVNLTFLGNLSETTTFNKSNCLWEICFADATRENLTQAALAGVHIIRHVSEYHDDQKNLLPECQKFNYSDWLNFVVACNISFADEIISDIAIDYNINKETAIITTGRTANLHFQEVLSTLDINSFEYEKILYPRLFSAELAILMWREDQWECLTSIWIAKNTEFIHNTNNQQTLDLKVGMIDQNWIKTDWVNMAQTVFDHAVFFKTVLKRPITFISTEDAVSNYSSSHKKINYNKQTVIANYNQTKEFYQNSAIANTLNFLYNKTCKKLPSWTQPV